VYLARYVNTGHAKSRVPARILHARPTKKHTQYKFHRSEVVNRKSRMPPANEGCLGTPSNMPAAATSDSSLLCRARGYRSYSGNWADMNRQRYRGRGHVVEISCRDQLSRSVDGGLGVDVDVNVSVNDLLLLETRWPTAPCPETNHFPIASNNAGNFHSQSCPRRQARQA
jgi:hypothetical protein